MNNWTQVPVEMEYILILAKKYEHLLLTSDVTDYLAGVEGGDDSAEDDDEEHDDEAFDDSDTGQDKNVEYDEEGEYYFDKMSLDYAQLVKEYMDDHMLSETQLWELAMSLDRVKKSKHYVLAGQVAKGLHARDDVDNRHRAKLIIHMLWFLRALARRQIGPFFTMSWNNYQEYITPKPLDWSRIPHDLAYLISPAEKYGRHKFDPEVEFSKQLSSSEVQELRELSERIDEKKYAAAHKWMFSENGEEEWVVLTLFEVMDDVGLMEHL